MVIGRTVMASSATLSARSAPSASLILAWVATLAAASVTPPAAIVTVSVA